MQIATPPATGCTARRRKRQAAVYVAKAREPEKPAAPTRSILKQLQTAEAEKMEREKKGEEEAARKEVKKAGREEEEKAAAIKRWEEGELSQKEGETYSAAARQIWDLTGDADDTEEVAAGRRIAHMAGIRALGSQWEEDRARGRTAPLQRQRHQQQRHQQQRQQQQQPAPPERQQELRPQRQQQRYHQKPASPQAPQQGQQQSSWAQRAVATVALPQEGFKRVGCKGKEEHAPTGLEQLKHSIPRDERGIVFERATGAPQIDLAVVASAAAHVNIALSKVAPTYVRTEAFRISVQGRLSTTARFGASAALLLRFKKEVLEAARKSDRDIINVVAIETWAEL